LNCCRVRSCGRGAFICDFVEGQAGIGVDGILPGKGLPPLDRDIDEAWLKLDRVGPPADALRRQNGRAGSAETVEHDVAATGNPTSSRLDAVKLQRHLTLAIRLLPPAALRAVQYFLITFGPVAVTIFADVGKLDARYTSSRPRVYQASAEAFDLKPSECMMVSASGHDADTAGAAAAGLRTASVARPDELGPGTVTSTPGVPVDIIAKDLNDLADKLGA
jgi:hypothetical protein